MRCCRLTWGVSGINFSADDRLMESGMDSLAATELQNSLQQELGTAVRLPSTMVFDHPTPVSISEFLSSQLVGVIEHNTQEENIVTATP